MLTNLLAKCICTPILGEWYSSVGKNRGDTTTILGYCLLELTSTALVLTLTALVLTSTALGSEPSLRLVALKSARSGGGIGSPPLHVRKGIVLTL